MSSGLVCWDVEQYIVALNPTKSGNSKSRAVIYTCYTLCLFSSSYKKSKKLLMNLELLTIGHINQNFSLSNQGLMEELIPVKPIIQPKVSKLGLKLAGF